MLTECVGSTLAGFFLGGVHWQWPCTLLRKDPRVLGDVVHSVMFPFLFLCNILTKSVEVYSEYSQASEAKLFHENS